MLKKKVDIKKYAMNTQEKTKQELINELQKISFNDIFNLNEIQDIQDLFAEVHGVASIITDINGNPLTKASNFSRLCKTIIRKTEKGCANCFKSDSVIGNYNPTGANIQTCLSSGLWDAGASITVAGKHIANWFIGQVRNENTDEQKLLQYADEIGVDRLEYKSALDEITIMSVDKFEKIAKLLFVIANELSEKAYTNLQLKNKIATSNQSHKSLKESEERFQLLFNKAPLGYQSLDIDGHFIDVNQQWLDTLGYERDEVVGKWFGNFLTPKYVKGFQESFQIFKAQGHIHAEFEMLHKNGSILFIAFDGKIGNDTNGNFKQTHCILQNITENRRINKALKKVEHQHRTILQTAMDGFWLIDLDGKFIEVNDAYCSMSGYTKKELLTMCISDVEVLENRVNTEIHIKNIIQSGHDRFESKHRRKDGSVYNVEISTIYNPEYKNAFVVFGNLIKDN